MNLMKSYEQRKKGEARGQRNVKLYLGSAVLCSFLPSSTVFLHLSCSGSAIPVWHYLLLLWGHLRSYLVCFYWQVFGTLTIFATSGEKSRWREQKEQHSKNRIHLLQFNLFGDIYTYIPAKRKRKKTHWWPQLKASWPCKLPNLIASYSQLGLLTARNTICTSEWMTIPSKDVCTYISGFQHV